MAAFFLLTAKKTAPLIGDQLMKKHGEIILIRLLRNLNSE
jgi:hypothetical protein